MACLKNHSEVRLHNVGASQTSLLEAGVTFFNFLVLTPTIAAMVMICGVAGNVVQPQIASLAIVLPAEARSLIEKQLIAAVTTSTGVISRHFFQPTLEFGARLGLRGRSRYRQRFINGNMDDRYWGWPSPPTCLPGAHHIPLAKIYCTFADRLGRSQGRSKGRWIGRGEFGAATSISMRLNCQ